MAVTSTPNLVTKLQSNYPSIIFRPATRFSFRPPHTVHYNTSDEPHYDLLLLHELGHALCGHQHFDTHIERLKMEREAWDQAAKLCKQFSVIYDVDFVESQLDTYRDWLHVKSKCQKCGLTRYQTGDGRYHCPYCND